jgi:hypothetical protein
VQEVGSVLRIILSEPLYCARLSSKRLLAIFDFYKSVFVEKIASTSSAVAAAIFDFYKSVFVEKIASTSSAVAASSAAAGIIKAEYEFLNRSGARLNLDII